MLYYSLCYMMTTTAAGGKRALGETMSIKWISCGNNMLAVRGGADERFVAAVSE